MLLPKNRAKKTRGTNQGEAISRQKEKNREDFASSYELVDIRNNMIEQLLRYHNITEHVLVPIEILKNLDDSIDMISVWLSNRIERTENFSGDDDQDTETITDINNNQNNQIFPSSSSSNINQNNQIFPSSSSSNNQIFPSSSSSNINQNNQIFPSSSSSNNQIFPSSSSSNNQIFPSSSSSNNQIFPSSSSSNDNRNNNRFQQQLQQQQIPTITSDNGDDLIYDTQNELFENETDISQTTTTDTESTLRYNFRIRTRQIDYDTGPAPRKRQCTRKCPVHCRKHK